MSNEQREDAAAAALNEYCLTGDKGRAYAEEPLQDKVSDLLADLLHFAAANRQPLDLERAVRVAQMNYEAERVTGDKNELWELLGDTPIDEDEKIDEPFLHFPKGTHRELIWRWFEEEFEGFSVGKQMEGDAQ